MASCIFRRSQSAPDLSLHIKTSEDIYVDLSDSLNNLHLNSPNKLNRNISSSPSILQLLTNRCPTELIIRIFFQLSTPPLTKGRKCRLSKNQLNLAGVNQRLHAIFFKQVIQRLETIDVSSNLLQTISFDRKYLYPDQYNIIFSTQEEVLYSLVNSRRKDLPSNLKEEKRLVNAFSAACRDENIPSLKALLNLYATCFSKEVLKQALCEATKEGQLNRVSFLLMHVLKQDEGANLEDLCQDIYASLEQVSPNESRELVKLAVSLFKQDPQHESLQQLFSLLVKATEEGRFEDLRQLLVKFHIDVPFVSSVSDEPFYTNLLNAAIKGRYDPLVRILLVVNSLLQRPILTPSDLKTALYVCIQANNLPIFNNIVEQIAYKGEEDEFLLNAAHYGADEIISHLLKNNDYPQSSFNNEQKSYSINTLFNALSMALNAGNESTFILILEGFALPWRRLDAYMSPGPVYHSDEYVHYLYLAVQAGFNIDKVLACIICSNLDSDRHWNPKLLRNSLSQEVISKTLMIALEEKNPSAISQIVPFVEDRKNAIKKAVELGIDSLVWVLVETYSAIISQYDYKKKLDDWLQEALTSSLQYDRLSIVNSILNHDRFPFEVCYGRNSAQKSLLNYQLREVLRNAINQNATSIVHELLKNPHLTGDDLQMILFPCYRQCYRQSIKLMRLVLQDSRVKKHHINRILTRGLRIEWLSIHSLSFLLEVLQNRHVSKETLMKLLKICIKKRYLRTLEILIHDERIDSLEAEQIARKVKHLYNYDLSYSLIHMIIFDSHHPFLNKQSSVPHYPFLLSPF